MSFAWCLQVVYFSFVIQSYYAKANQIYQVYSYSRWCASGVKKLCGWLIAWKSKPNELEAPSLDDIYDENSIELTAEQGVEAGDQEPWNILETKSSY